MRNWDEDEDGYCTAAADLQDARARLRGARHPAAHGQFRRRVPRAGVRALPRRAARRPHAEPGRRLQSRDQVRRLLRARRAGSAPAGSRPATTRGSATVDGRPRLLRAADRDKDQTYFLHAVPGALLARTLFPIGDLTKAEVRRIAARAGAAGARQARQHGHLLHRRAAVRASSWPATCPARPGPIETDGRPRARRAPRPDVLHARPAPGPAIGGVRGAAEAPWYVARKDLARNVLVVVAGARPPAPDEPSSSRPSPCHWIGGRSAGATSSPAP